MIPYQVAGTATTVLLASIQERVERLEAWMTSRIELDRVLASPEQIMAWHLEEDHGLTEHDYKDCV